MRSIIDETKHQNRTTKTDQILKKSRSLTHLAIKHYYKIRTDF